MSDIQVISGTRRAIKEMADGTIRVQIDIDPTCRGAFWSLFPSIDMPVAIAPLVADFEQRAPESDKAKGGELAKLAGRLCQDDEFRNFLATTYGVSWRIAYPVEDIAQWIREQCGIASRAELDHDDAAAAIFHKVIRGPWIDWRASRGLK